MGRREIRREINKWGEMERDGERWGEMGRDVMNHVCTGYYNLFYKL